VKKVTADACPYPWDWVMITADGEVRPCCYAKAPVGNLNDNTFEEIWNGRTMLEIRYFIDHEQLHSACRGAPCKYSEAKAGTKARPYEVKDCRYAFLDVAVRRGEGDLEVAGKVANRSDTAWFLFDDLGTPRVRIGARVVDPVSGAALQELFYPIQGQALFPGESAPFEFRVKRQAGATLKLDVCSQGSFWFEERGEKPVVIPL